MTTVQAMILNQRAHSITSSIDTFAVEDDFVPELEDGLVDGPRTMSWDYDEDSSSLASSSSEEDVAEVRRVDTACCLKKRFSFSTFLLLLLLLSYLLFMTLAVACGEIGIITCAGKAENEKKNQKKNSHGSTTTRNTTNSSYQDYGSILVTKN